MLLYGIYTEKNASHGNTYMTKSQSRQHYSMQITKSELLSNRTYILALVLSNFVDFLLNSSNLLFQLHNATFKLTFTSKVILLVYGGSLFVVFIDLTSFYAYNSVVFVLTIVLYYLFLTLSIQSFQTCSVNLQ